MTTQKSQISKGNHLKKILIPILFYFVIIIGSFLLLDSYEFNFNFIILLFLIFFISSIFFLFFFSQFALPVLTTEKRIKASQRLFSYLFGDHGPTIFIENGEIRERKIDRLKNGPGVVILDTASAAVLRTPVRYEGSIGPGIAFTERDESIAGVVDLHIQTNYLGPRPGEDPFALIQKNESKAAYEARIARRDESMAITRDGIQICINLKIRFKLDSNPGEGNSAFGYNPLSVEKAVIGQSISTDKPDDNPEKVYSWKKLPNNLVMDVFREYISKYTINELFPLSRSEKNPIRIIIDQLNSRLTQSHYQNYDNYGNKTDEVILSKEFDLLKRRGIKFLDISVTNIRFPTEIEEELTNRWKTSWLEVAYKDKKVVEQQHSIQTIAGQNQAVMDYAYGATKYLGSKQNSENISKEEILISLIKGNQETISQNPDLSTQLVNEYQDLSDLIDWVRSQRGEV